MRRAVLIGFQYSADKKLPGIIIDLYQVYFFLKNNGWKEKEIKVLTDIEKDESTDTLKIAILNNTVDSEILSFIEDLKERAEYTKFISRDYYNNLSSLFTHSDYYFVYFTGHAKNGNIVLPDNSHLSFSLFKNLLIGKKNICVLDCCEAEIDLPFVLIDGLYRLKTLNFTKTEIVCISSSSQKEKSLTSKSGSVFTRRLFEILKDSGLSFPSILKQIGLNNEIGQITQFNNDKISTVSISVTHPNIYCLYGFVYSFPVFSFELGAYWISINR